MKLPPNLPSIDKLTSAANAVRNRRKPEYEDSELTRPLSDWDKRDREGKVGTMVMVGPLGDKYDQIDWSDDIKCDMALIRVLEKEREIMPKILDDRVKALMKKGMSKSRAYAIATSALQKEGKIKKKMNRMSKGKKRRR